MAEVELKGVSKAYGPLLSVDNVDLSIRQGEFISLLGPSGCGKTTTLRIVAGFVSPTSGDVRIGGRSVVDIPPNKRDTGLVFQHFALFPHMTVTENLAFGLKVRKLSRQEIARRVKEALELVRLGDFGDRLPRSLSGGQQQRVALARAVVTQPQVLLLDEPLSALDLKLRQELQIYIKDVQKALAITTIYVTHDQGEALRLSDRIAVMRAGRIEQLDEPARIYQRPSTAFVARFVGEMNFLPVTFEALEGGVGRFRLGDGETVRAPWPQTMPPTDGGTPMLLGFRPENARPGSEGGNGIAGTVSRADYQGPSWAVTLSCPGAILVRLDLPSDRPLPKLGVTLGVRWPVQDTLVYPAEEA